MSDEQPGDVRDTLSGLERRLREIEGDLRSGASGPEAQTPAVGGTGKADSGGSGGGRQRPSGLLIAGLCSAALLIVVLVAVLASSGGSTQSSSAGPSEIVLGAGLSGNREVAGIAKLSGARAARGNAAAEACAGTAGAALVIVQPAPKTVGCAGLKELLTMTVSATGVAQPGGSGRCLRRGQVAAQLRRPARSLTRQRAARVLKARRAAAAKAQARGASGAASINAQRRAGATAGSNFDSANRLSLTKVRNASGSCVAPTASALRSGAYPLSVEVALLARPDSASNASVTEAEATLRKALSGAVPVEAAVPSR
jgi:hypothetical protein